MRAICCLLTFLMLCQPQAFAWSDAGHKIVASIAFRRLTSEEQAKVIEILRNHPRFATDFTMRMPNGISSAGEATKNDWAFQQAAVWPDIMRPPGPAAETAFHRGEWHYINLPHFLDEASRTALANGLDLNLERDPPADATEETRHMNAIQAIRLAREKCADPAVDDETRGVLLAWLFHLVGDIHQPLHSTALFSQNLFPEGDKGGNGVDTEQRGNLHALWDQLPGRSMNYSAARNRAIELANDEGLMAIGESAAAQLDEETWLNESHQAAVSVVYGPEVFSALRVQELSGGDVEFPPLDLSEDYFVAGRQVANRRLVQAGYRLGAVLKEIVAE